MEALEHSYSFVAGSGISAATMFHLVKMSADRTVVLAAAATDSPIGVQQSFVTGAVGVANSGLSKVRYGDTVTAGQLLCSDASGHAVPASPGAGVNNGIIGWAVAGGAANDIGEVLLAPSIKQG